MNCKINSLGGAKIPYFVYKWRHGALLCLENTLKLFLGLFCCRWLFLLLPLWESVTVLCFVVPYFMFILILQSSWWGRESWLLCLISLHGVSWWLSGSSSRCHGVVCGLWLWYFLIILTYYFWNNCNKKIMQNRLLLCFLRWVDLPQSLFITWRYASTGSCQLHA